MPKQFNNETVLSLQRTKKFMKKNNISQTEENYLKAIFKLYERLAKTVSTNAIAQEMNTAPPSVTDMLNRLNKKGLVHYEKRKGAILTKDGIKIATGLIRRHRLWEVFLLEKLNFSWDEVHELAEQLEHIKSEKLVSRLDAYLGYPKYDPHGDPIPDEAGNFTLRKQVLLSDLKTNTGIVAGVQEHSTAFLQYLDRLKLILGASIEIIERFEYDGAIKMKINGMKEQVISHKVAQNVYIIPKEINTK